MVGIKNLWGHSPACETTAWASIWMMPQPGIWSFTVDDVINLVNQWLACLGSEFRFVPDPLLSDDHYAWMKMRDHTQAVALTMLGRMAAQTLLDESEVKR